MAYIINGPVTLGDAATSTIVKGNVSVPNVSSATGDIFYTSNVSGSIAALNKVSAGVLLSDTATSLPVWLANGTAGQVLTANSGANPSWQTPSSEVGSYGFSANYTNATAQTSIQATYSTGTITQAGFVVTGTTTVFTAAMVGGQLTYGANTYLITGFSSGTSISVFPANTQGTAVSYSITYGTPVLLTNWDTGTLPCYDSTSGGFVASTGVFTNSNAIGKYIIDAQITYIDGANDGYRALQVLRNNTVVMQTIQQANSNKAIAKTLTVSGALRLAATDTIKIQFVNTGISNATVVASVAANGTSSTRWSMALQATA